VQILVQDDVDDVGDVGSSGTPCGLVRWTRSPTPVRLGVKTSWPGRPERAADLAEAVRAAPRAVHQNEDRHPWGPIPRGVIPIDHTGDVIAAQRAVSTPAGRPR